MIDKTPGFGKNGGAGDSFDDDDLNDAKIKPDIGTTPDIDNLDDNPDNDDALDSAAIIAAQKRRGNNILIFGGAICAVVFIAVGYPQFKHYFVADKPVVDSGVATPVPMSARKNYFAGNDKPADGTSPGATADTAAPADTGVQANATPPAPAAPDATSATAQPSTTGAALPPPPAQPPVTDGTTVPSTAPAATPAATTAAATPAVQPPLPAEAAATPAADDQLKALKDSVDKLTAAHDADVKQIQSLQASLTALQQQPQPAAAPAQPAPAHKAVTRHKTATSPAWVLRSATSGMALIGHPGANDLKKIEPGDVVTGLGKITSIEEQDGSWVVHGTGGSLEQ